MRYFQILLTEGDSFSLYKIQYSLYSSPTVFTTANIYNTSDLAENLTTTQLSIPPGITIQVPDGVDIIKSVNQDGICVDVIHDTIPITPTPGPITPTPTPTPTASPTPTPGPATPTPTLAPITPTPTPTPTASPITPTPTPTFSHITPTPTPTAAPITPTPTIAPGTGTCKFVFVPDSVGGAYKTRYGLRYGNTSGTITDATFANMIGALYTYGGEPGVIYAVCSTAGPQQGIVWDSVTNTLVAADVTIVWLENGGSCTTFSECTYSPATPTPTPTPTQAPATPTPTPTPVQPTFTALNLRMNLNNAPYGWTTPTLACNGVGTSLTVYVQPSYSNWSQALGSNATVYTDSGLTNVLAATGGNQYYQEGSGNYLRIDNFGELLAYASCPSGPTPTPTPTQTPATPTPTPTPSLTAFLTNASPETSGNSACNAGLGTTRYHDGNGTYPTIGNTIYLNNSTSGKLGAGYWGLSNGTYFITNISGVVTDLQLCPSGPTPTPIPGPSYNYYMVDECDGGPTVYKIRIADTLSINQAIDLFGGCRRIYANASGPSYDIDVTGTAVYANCDACDPPAPTTPTPTPTPALPTPTPTPAPTPADNIFGVERVSDGFSTYAQLAQGYSINDLVTISNDGSSCYEIMFIDYVVNPSIFPTITGPCATPAPTPTPTPAPPSCIPLLGVGRSTVDPESACSGRTGQHYFNDEDLCSSTAYYGLNSDCSPETTGYYVAENSFYRYWNGSRFTTGCIECPGVNI
jgi:hypothetical protein